MRFKSRSRALAASAVAASLALGGLALTASPANAEPADIVRVSGATRYGTAAAAAVRAYPSGATNVVLASGEAFPDALSAGGFAGSLDAPILLTPSDRLDDTTLAALDDLGATTVYVMGGSAAVSDDVVDALEAEGYTVVRVAGADRFETAAMTAEEIGASDTAVLANGFRFADALAISPGAHALELPILLTGPTALNDDAADALEDVDTVIIVGGTAVVSQAIEDGLEAAGKTVVRLAGDNRYESGVEIAEFHFDNGFDDDELVMATGENFADALAGGPLASQLMAPLVLTQTNVLTPATRDFIEGIAPQLGTIYILGGTAAVTDAVANAAAAAADEGTAPIGPNEVFSDAAPELVQVTEVEENVVAFEFDETVTGQALEFTGTAPNRQYFGFRIYNPAGGVSYPLEARIEGDTVIARFADGVVEAGSLASVRYNAVEDSTGLPNIEGDFPMVPQVVTNSTAPFSPQLVKVDNYRTANVITGGTAELLIDYTFNSATAVTALGLDDGLSPLPPLIPGNDANEFYLVGQFGAEYQADGIQNIATTPAEGANPGQQVVTVAYSVDPTQVPETQLRRGYVVADDAAGADTDAEEAGSPADTDGFGLVLSEAFESGSDVTENPDLVSVTRSGTSYRFEFDEAVSDAATELVAGGFYVFDAAGNITPATSVARSADAADEARVVVATLPTLPMTGAGTPVDAFVADGAVRATDSTDDQNSGYNRPDEVILTLPAAETDQPPAGITDKPDLVSIARDQNVVTENFSITYTFDAGFGGLTDAQVQNIAFDLYDDNGIQFRVTGLDCTTAGVDCDGNSITFSLDDGFGGFSNEQIDAAVTGGVEDVDNTDEATADIVVTEGQTGITDM